MRVLALDIKKTDSPLRDYQAARRKTLKIKQVSFEISNDMLLKLNDICKYYKQSKKDIINYLIDNYKY